MTVASSTSIVIDDVSDPAQRSAIDDATRAPATRESVGLLRNGIEDSEVVPAAKDAGRHPGAHAAETDEADVHKCPTVSGGSGRPASTLFRSGRRRPSG